jgi:hypothetical protein
MTPTHDSPTRLTAAQWIEEARLCKRDGRPDLVPFCLNQAAALAAEDERTIAEMLLNEEAS